MLGKPTEERSYCKMTAVDTDRLQEKGCVSGDEGRCVGCEGGRGVSGEVSVGGGVRCGFEFYNCSCEELARALLGCVLVCQWGGEEGGECRGRVVEVEAYLGGEDKAAHSYNGRCTEANKAMFMVSACCSHLLFLPSRRPFFSPSLPAARYGLCLLCLRHTLLFQCVQCWPGGSRAGAGTGATDWNGTDVSQEEDSEERERPVQWSRETMSGHGHQQTVSGFPSNWPFTYCIYTHTHTHTHTGITRLTL